MYYYTYCFNLRSMIFKEIICHLEVLFIARNKYLECVMREGRTTFSFRWQGYFIHLKQATFNVKLYLNIAHFFIKNVNIRIEFHSECIYGIMNAMVKLANYPWHASIQHHVLMSTADCKSHKYLASFKSV